MSDGKPPEEKITDAVADAAEADRARASAEESGAEAEAAQRVSAAAAAAVGAAEAGAALAKTNAAESMERTAADIEEFKAWNATQLENFNQKLTQTDSLMQSRIAEQVTPLAQKLEQITAAMALLIPVQPQNGEGVNPQNAGGAGPEKMEAQQKKRKIRHI